VTSGEAVTIPQYCGKGLDDFHSRYVGFLF
jgi:hypothetical protein